MNYRFQEGKHLHQLEVDGEWKNLTGCTTILGVVAKPALIQWAANMAVDYVKEKASWIDPFLTEEEYNKVLEEARKAHCRRKEKAGDWGTQVHSEIESYIKNELEGKSNEVYPDSIENFVKWTKDNKVKFIATEKNVWSESLFLGGIIDFLCEINGEVWIGDIKTSKSGLYAENFWQCGGYEIMLNECSDYKNIKGYVLLNLKESGDFLEKRSVSNEEHKKAFMACYEIYRQKEKTNNQLI